MVRVDHPAAESQARAVHTEVTALDQAAESRARDLVDTEVEDQVQERVVRAAHMDTAQARAVASQVREAVDTVDTAVEDQAQESRAREVVDTEVEDLIPSLQRVATEDMAVDQAQGSLVRDLVDMVDTEVEDQAQERVASQEGMARVNLVRLLFVMELFLVFIRLFHTTHILCSSSHHIYIIFSYLTILGKGHGGSGYSRPTGYKAYDGEDVRRNLRVGRTD